LENEFGSGEAWKPDWFERYEDGICRQIMRKLKEM
jgi:hypothetical protein